MKILTKLQFEKETYVNYWFAEFFIVTFWQDFRQDFRQDFHQGFRQDFFPNWIGPQEIDWLTIGQVKVANPW